MEPGLHRPDQRPFRVLAERAKYFQDVHSRASQSGSGPKDSSTYPHTLSSQSCTNAGSTGMGRTKLLPSKSTWFRERDWLRVHVKLW